LFDGKCITASGGWQDSERSGAHFCFDWEMR
jgi:hypothetical protein